MGNENCRKPGGQPGNLNAAKHGARTDRPVVLGEWGEHHTTSYQHGKHLRRWLERHVTDSQGQVSLEAGLEIDAAVRWEMTAKITQNLIAKNPNLEPDQVVSYLNTIANATRQRNAAVAKLGINGKAADGDPWEKLDSQAGLDANLTEGGPQGGQ